MTRTFIAVMLMIAMSPITVAAADLSAGDDLTKACRLLVSNEPALSRLLIEDVDRHVLEGSPVVTFRVAGAETWERGYLSCTFDDGARPPVLTQFVEATCSECGAWWDDDRLAEANRRLSDYWPTQVTK
jgi:hypothetical protein